MVLRWTWNSLIAEPWHLLASVGAIGAAFALVLFFEAVFAGESRQIVAYARHADADVWVMQRGVSNMHMATSFVSDWKADRIARIEGVSKVTPILYLNTVMRAGEGNWFSFIVGLDPDDPRAGPWAVTQGKRLPGTGEALVPAVLVRLAGLSLGDSISIAGHRFVVVGLTDGTFSMANSITFVTMPDLADVMSSFGTMSYFLVDAAPGVDSARLAERIEREVEKVNAVPNEAFIRNDWAVAMQMGVEIIGLMTLIGGALAILLTGFAVYSSTARRERELAVMKALGFRNRAIYASVMAQAGSLAVLGFLLAASLVFIATPLTAHFVPQVTLQVLPEALVRVFVAALAVALLACVIPVRRVVRVEPLSAFRG
jgi:putative ABC transport system permease protein